MRQMPVILPALLFGLATPTILVAASALPDSSIVGEWQTFVFSDSTMITARIVGEEESRYTVVPRSGLVYTVPKRSIVRMGPEGTVADPVAPATSLRLQPSVLELPVVPVDPDRWTWTIGTSSGRRMEPVGLAGLAYDSLYISDSGGVEAISIDSIGWLRRDDGTHAGRGMLTGLLFGTAVLGAAANFSQPVVAGGLFLFTFGPIAGALIGSGMKDYHDVDLSGLDHYSRSETLLHIIETERLHR